MGNEFVLRPYPNLKNLGALPLQLTTPSTIPLTTQESGALIYIADSRCDIELERSMAPTHSSSAISIGADLLNFPPPGIGKDPDRSARIVPALSSDSPSSPENSFSYPPSEKSSLKNDGHFRKLFKFDTDQFEDKEGWKSFRVTHSHQYP